MKLFHELLWYTLSYINSHLSVCVKCEFFYWKLQGLNFRLRNVIMHTETQIITTPYVFRLSTIELLVPRVSCCILAAINRAILLCSPSNAGILMNWSLSYLLVFCCFNLFLWQRLIIQLSLGLYVNVFCVINITQARKKCS